MHNQDIDRIAAERLGIAELRPTQRKGIESVLEGRDTVVVMRTGAGKSAIYQVAALTTKAPAVVVSPLISLQQDQAGALRDRELDVTILNSTVNVLEVVEEIPRGPGFVFVTPEQLAKTEVADALAGLSPSMVVVDEAHCVSSWGHDFRPDYLQLGRAVERLGRPVVLALTATAAQPVRAEIVERLGLRDPRVLVAGFDRPNLFLGAQIASDPDSWDEEVLKTALQVTRPASVYVLTRRSADALATRLSDEGLAAAAYHAGMTKTARTTVHEDFLDGRLEVVVATTAFGMGIDKPDVRSVVHAGLPDSLDSYYQEIGRAGRDGAAATASLLHRPGELGLRKFLSSAPPAAEKLAQVRNAVSGSSKPLTRRDIARETGLSAAMVGRCCSWLEQAGGVTMDSRNRVRAGDVPDAVDRAVAAGEQRREIDDSRLELMRAYAETADCRRQLLLGYFGEYLAEPCGNCDSCEAGVRTGPADDEYPPGLRVRHETFGDGIVLMTGFDRLVVRFDESGYRTLALAAVRDNDLLQPTS